MTCVSVEPPDKLISETWPSPLCSWLSPVTRPILVLTRHEACIHRKRSWSKCIQRCCFIFKFTLFRVDRNWVLMFCASGENRNIHRGKKKVCLHLLVCVYYFLPHKTKWKRTLISCYESSLLWRPASEHTLYCIRSLFKYATQILSIKWGNVYQIWKRADRTHHALQFS